jgi:hypothetical protein
VSTNDDATPITARSLFESDPDFAALARQIGLTHQQLLKAVESNADPVFAVPQDYSAEADEAAARAILETASAQVSRLDRTARRERLDGFVLRAPTMEERPRTLELAPGTDARMSTQIHAAMIQERQRQEQMRFDPSKTVRSPRGSAPSSAAGSAGSAGASGSEKRRPAASVPAAHPAAHRDLIERRVLAPKAGVGK